MAVPSMRWSRIATIMLGIGLGLVGCEQKTDSPRNVELNIGQNADNKGSDAKTVAPSGEPKPVSFFNDADPLHQPFAKAVRQGDDPPAECHRPPDATITGKSVYKLYQEVMRQWETIRFVSPEGKTIAYSATIETTMGVIDLDLRSDLAPNHVRNFVALSRAGYYDGLCFDRIYHDEAVDDPKQRFDEIEAGCPLGTGEQGYGSIGYWLNPEFNPTDK